MPTGTLVEIKIFSWPLLTDFHLNIDIFPSPSDVKNSSGLCGILDGNYENDLTRNDANNTVESNTNDASLEFQESWK